MPDLVYRSIPEQIVEQLRLEIMSGQIEVGSPLREQDLSQRFGVSRGPIRDALLKLAQEGLVNSRPNVGASVASQPRESIRPLITEIRRRIEVFALDDVFGELSADDNARMEQILVRIRVACEADSVPDLVAADVQFHEAIMTRYGDSDLLALWRRVIVRMMMRYDRFRDLQESYREHRRIFDAIVEGRKDDALRALEANIV